MQRHDYVTPYINGIRFFDKPPLMYWMAAGSMHLFGIHDWAARIPLALGFLALLLSVYALGIRLFTTVSPSANPDRGGFYAALAMATSIGPYLYTRFYIPDILLALWMTLAVHLFLIALDRINATPAQSALLPCLAFAAIMALNVLTKGLIGLVFPIAFVFLYLAITNNSISCSSSTSSQAQPSSFSSQHLGTSSPHSAPRPSLSRKAWAFPATGGWAWFYLYNEHIARFLSKRIPHDYGQTPIWLFWLFTALWMVPWVAFIPASIPGILRALRRKQAFVLAHNSNAPAEVIAHKEKSAIAAIRRNRQAAITLLLWIGIVLGFFTLSARQEYYGLPALPALALLAAGALAIADNRLADRAKVQRSLLRWSAWLLVPLTTLVAIICGYFAFTAHPPAPGTDIVSLLTMAGGTEAYNLSLSHVTDLTGAAMGFFRGPLAATALGMLGIGFGSYLLRRRGSTYAANLTLAAAMTLTLLAAHDGLTRFYPILGSRGLALAINEAQQRAPRPDDLIIIDGELTAGSTLIFYTGQQVHLINGRVNGLWFGSFWPDSPRIFETEDSLRQLWASPRRVFLFTYDPTTRAKILATYGTVQTLASAGGKTVLTNR